MHMGYQIRGSHVRIRTTLKHEWVWELVTDDGHVAFLSAGYADRDDCEEEARLQGLRVVGGRKEPRGRERARAPGLRVHSTACGLWTWEYVDERGSVAASSAVSFLTREECEHDLARHNLGSFPITPAAAQPSAAQRSIARTGP